MHTLSSWIGGLPAGALRDAAEDVRLCMQVDLLCEDVAGRRTSCDREGMFRPDVRPLAWAPRPAGLPGLVLASILRLVMQGILRSEFRVLLNKSLVVGRKVWLQQSVV